MEFFIFICVLCVVYYAYWEHSKELKNKDIKIKKDKSSYKEDEKG